MTHDLEIHNLAARGQLVQGAGTHSVRSGAPPSHDAKFLLAYNCGTCSFNSNDAVAAVDHVLRTHHPISIVGSIQAVPVTVLDIPEDVNDA